MTARLPLLSLLSLLLAATGVLAQTPGPACAPAATVTEDKAPAGPAAAVQDQAQGLVGMFLAGSSDVSDRLAKLVETQYPQLSQELIQFLLTEQPDLLTTVMPALNPLIRTEYPDVPRTIMQAIGKDEKLKLRVSQLVNEQYPGFVEDLAKLPPGPERRAQAADLVTQKYPDLYGAVLEVIQREFPDTLKEVQLRLAERYPRLLGDIAKLVARTFPRLTAKALNFVVHHYPQLLPQLISILYSSPAAEIAPAAPAATPPAAEAAPAAAPAPNPAPAPVATPPANP
ncbi:MAG TPA: hypothetical protein VGM19_03955 [Armatimonadota bacterium]|jgi:hypothetical protein